MFKRLLTSALVLFVLVISLSGQNYTARGYWILEHDSTYMILSNRSASGEQLSESEIMTLNQHKAKLAEYFNFLTDEEKSLYYKYRAQWSSKTPPVQDQDQVFSGERSTFTKYVLARGGYGFMYGLAGIYIFDFQSEAAAGIPFITAGMSSLLPLMTIKDKKVTTSSLLLSLHGRAIGAGQGAMLGLTLVGNDGAEGSDKLVLGTSMFSSIALGHIGYRLGAGRDWSAGKISLLSHYGWFVPLESVALLTAFEVDDARVYGIASLVSGAAGYFIADRIAERRNFTRGDVISIQTLTLLNTGLGFGIIGDLEEPGAPAILIPATLALAGTATGQLWMKNTKLTNQQGWNVSLATAAGSALGIGVSRLIAADEFSATDYFVPYATGLLTYYLMVNSYRIKNINIHQNNQLSAWQINFAPQNILINNRLAQSGRLPGNRMSLLPAFSAAVTF